MKKFLFMIINLLLPLLVFGQSYATLWKQVAKAEANDLPQTRYEVLQKLVAKAEKERQYGHLLKAELYGAQTMGNIAPDSLKPAVERLVARYEQTTDQVLRLVYQTVLYELSDEQRALGLHIDKPALTPEVCRLLAETKERAYRPFVVMGTDASVFDNDLLSVIGGELGCYQEMRQYYSEVGRQKAVNMIDAFMTLGRYQKLPDETSLLERLTFIDDAIAKWGSYPQMNGLRNARQRLINPQFHVSYELPAVRPGQAQQVHLTQLRNLSQLTMTVYPVRCEGDIDCTPSNETGYQRIKPLLGKWVMQEVKVFGAHADYAFFEDSVMLKGLPVGMYMVEFKTTPATEVVRTLYHVTDLYTIAEAQPNQQIRYVVVNATTGRPVAGAYLKIKEHISYKEEKTSYGMTNANGEYFLKIPQKQHSRQVFAYTDKDRAGVVLRGVGQYHFYEPERMVKNQVIFTDRSIYRPGQTLHASVLSYQVENGIEQQVCSNQKLTMVLRDANHKVIAEKQVVTNDYGVGATDFILPQQTLTGVFTIQVGNHSQQVRVEAYKRPTFKVDFETYKAAYKAGDVLDVKGKALSLAGVPVQGAQVRYKVLRRTAFWWFTYHRYDNQDNMGYSQHGQEVGSGETTTDADGQFVVKMPLEIPTTKQTMFYHFVVQADVTDVTGESHRAQYTLPLGNRETAFSADLEQQVLVEQHPTVTFHLRQAAGENIKADVRYRIDQGEWLTTQTGKTCQLPTVVSGKHTLQAICHGDTIVRTFVAFSLNDAKPATETDDWFYQSAEQFANDGTPVTIQVGSSASDVHIFYSIFAGRQLIEQGHVVRNNQLINRKFTYKPEYGNGLLLTYAWVKEGRCYTHTARIERPMPDKKLTLEWATFRDRLTPGQQETWTLTVKDADGKPVDANFMATLYDQSLDQLTKHQWHFAPNRWVSLPSVNWQYASTYRFSGFGARNWQPWDEKGIAFSQFDHDVYPQRFYSYTLRGVKSLGRANADDMVLMETAAPAALEVKMMKNAAAVDQEGTTDEAAQQEEEVSGEVPLRENLNETAFFYPQLTTDANGYVALKFTLPESLTTWQLLGLAHTRNLCYGQIQAEAVAKKDVMIQPNVPRFIREGDKATISARIFSEKQAQGKATLKLINAETNAIVYEKSQSVSLKPGETTAAVFECSMLNVQGSMLIVKMTVNGKGFSDGEQHYLPVLPANERVTISVPITQHQAGTTTIDLSQLIPADAKQEKLTLEYTDNPAWMMIQALPAIGTPNQDNAISLAASFYANSIGRYIIGQNPQIKAVFERWKQEEQNQQLAALSAQLEKNESLKELVLSETPWVMDADNEREQKHRLADFFDENLMNGRLSQCIAKLQKLQQPDGAWTWFPEMPGSFYMTVAVSEMLVRLNTLTTPQSATREMLDRAFGFMGDEVVKLVKELKQQAKDGHAIGFPGYQALQWLYLATLDGRQLPAEVQQANNYLLTWLKKDIKRQSIYEKALSAVIFAKTDSERGKTYAQSLKEYTVYREDMGRYYDTHRAGYSWFDHKIPTQTVAIEALQLLTPEDTKTINEMQRWLLQQKRTQAWDTPINSVNAVYAFLKGQTNRLGQQQQSASIHVDARRIDLPKETAAIGYVKTALPKGKRLTVNKTSQGTSWGAVYAQYFQKSKAIASHSSGLSIQREMLSATQSSATQFAVGDRVKVRLTITADRDYDFVQVVDKRAACMEPVKQLSGYHRGAYVAPRDNTTCYFYDRLSKGKHVIETEYYIDRAGTYETGTATVTCAYAPEFRGTTKSETLKIKH